MMSNWDADQPGVTWGWWSNQREHVPFYARTAFDAFVTALKFYYGMQVPSMTQMDKVLKCIEELQQQLHRKISVKHSKKIAWNLVVHRPQSKPYLAIPGTDPTAENRLLTALDNVLPHFRALASPVVPQAYADY